MRNFIKCSICSEELLKTNERSMKKCEDCALAE